MLGLRWRGSRVRVDYLPLFGKGTGQEKAAENPAYYRVYLVNFTT